MKNYLDQIGLGAYLCGVVIIANMRAQPTVGGTISKMMGLECVRKLAEHETERSRKQYSTMVFSLVPALTSMMDCDLSASKPFSPQVSPGYCFIIEAESKRE